MSIIRSVISTLLVSRDLIFSIHKTLTLLKRLAKFCKILSSFVNFWINKITVFKIQTCHFQSFNFQFLNFIIYTLISRSYVSTSVIALVSVYQFVNTLICQYVCNRSRLNSSVYQFISSSIYQYVSTSVITLVSVYQFISSSVR